MDDFSDITVLIVDDKLTNAWVVRKMLERIGIGTVVLCASGDEARKAITRLPRVDLVMLDLRLPEEDGYEIYQSLKENPTLSETRFLAATAHVFPLEMRRTKDSGFDGFISKPFRLARLKKQIETILAGDPVWEMQ